MREIKFRVWLPQINRMMYNEDIYTDKLEEFRKLNNYNYPLEGDEFYPWYAIYNWLGLETNLEYMIPSQYTGLKDINGKGIYEGDIIPFHFDENVRGIVKFGEYKNPCDDKFSKHQGFYVEFINRDALRKDLGYWATVSKVIGNIYENPELLERD